MISLVLSTNNFKCSLDLKEKVTFIKGNSGVGKTTLIDYLSRDGIQDFVSISNNFGYEILTKSRFKDIVKNAIKHIERDNGVIFKSLDSKTRKKLLYNYWKSDSLNFPYQDSIIFTDDEDFVSSLEFTAFFDADKYNYYVIINRTHLATIGYSVDSVYDLVADGSNHYLRPRYTLEQDSSPSTFDFIVTEGVGSDYIFFKELWGDKVINPTYANKLSSGGRSNVVKMLELNKDIFKGKKLFLFIDYVAFGSNFESLNSFCNSNNIDFSIISTYKSFEYLLLKSNLINDLDLDTFTECNRLKFNSLETLYTFRLEQLTRDSLLSYSKKSDSFSVCYYKDCCENSKYRDNLCDLRLRFSRNKLSKMLSGTVFDSLLKLILI